MGVSGPTGRGGPFSPGICPCGGAAAPNPVPRLPFRPISTGAKGAAAWPLWIRPLLQTDPVATEAIC